MSDRPQEHSEFDALAERWCEGLLQPEEAARLEQLVLSDPVAMDRYLGYVALHGTLHWDTAAGAEPGHDLRPVTQAAKHPASRTGVPQSGWSRRRVTLAATGAVSAAILIGLLLLPDAALGPQLAEQAGDPPAADSNPQRDDLRMASDAEESGRSTPVVRLDRPEARDPEHPASSADTVPIVAVNSEPALPISDVVTFLDRELAEGWRENQIEPSPIASDAEWLRRVSLDLTGRIPHLDTVQTFVADESPRKRVDFIEDVLEREEYARHFTTIWSNLLVGRSANKREERRGLERFLIHRFRRNLPWNDTVAELVAAEGSIAENGATGFLLAHLNNEAVPATAITARLFLCQQVQCTQCHKHPWNDWTQEQFWELNSFFQQAGIERRQEVDEQSGQTRTVRALTDRAVGGPTYFEDLRGIMQVAYPKFDGETIDASRNVDRREQLAQLLSGEDHLQLARAMVNRTWAHFFGYGFTNPVDDMGPHQTVTHPALLDRLSREFAASGYDIQQLIRWITASRAYQLTSRRAPSATTDDPDLGDPPAFSRVYLKPLSPEQVYDSLTVLTEEVDAPTQDFTALAAARQEWLQQFFEVLDNEENGEVSTFDGTLPQALLMMNGSLIRRATSTDSDGVLARIVASRTSDSDRIRQVCQATLSREPTERELNTFRRHVQQAKSRSSDPRAATAEALKDVFWAYLNSSEFVVNH